MYGKVIRIKPVKPQTNSSAYEDSTTVHRAAYSNAYDEEEEEKHTFSDVPEKNPFSMNQLWDRE